MTVATYARHPLSSCFGDMDEDEFLKFKDDIEAHGQHEPVLIFDGMVLDGWHRYLAVTQLGMDLQKFTFAGTFEEAQERAVSSNDKRKHRTVSQRAQAIVAVHACRPVGRPQKGNSAPGAELNSAPAKPAKEIAAAHGIGTRSVERARVVQAAGLGHIVMDGALSGKEAEAIATGKIAKPAKAAAAPKPVATPAPADDGPTASEIAASERAAAEELEALRKIALADDKVAAALDEAKKLRALNRVLQERNDGLMNEKAELVKRIKSLQRKLDKLEQPA